MHTAEAAANIIWSFVGASFFSTHALCIFTRFVSYTNHRIVAVELTVCAIACNSHALEVPSKPLLASGEIRGCCFTCGRWRIAAAGGCCCITGGCCCITGGCQGCITGACCQGYITAGVCIDHLCKVHCIQVFAEHGGFAPSSITTRAPPRAFEIRPVMAFVILVFVEDVIVYNRHLPNELMSCKRHACC